MPSLAPIPLKPVSAAAQNNEERPILNIHSDPDDLLSTARAAHYLMTIGYKMSEATLKEYRAKKRGPSYIRFPGIVKYKRRDLNEWAEGRVRRIIQGKR